jgi:hypothetical protein
VHGINNEGDTAANIGETWLRALEDGWRAAERTVEGARLRTGAAYYGDKLAESTNRWDRNKLSIIDQGGNYLSDDDEVAATLYGEYGRVLYEERGTNEPELKPEAVEMGFPHMRSTKRAALLIEALDPKRGGFLVERFLPQAAAYIQRPGLRSGIDRIVDEALRGFAQPGKPLIVISHSLGTVVSYAVLRRADYLGQIPVALVTIGSPLGSRAMQKILPAPRIKPACVKQWVNAADRRDFVAIRYILDEKTFGKVDIKNLEGLENGEEDRHSIIGYLKTKVLAKAIFELLDSWAARDWPRNASDSVI